MPARRTALERALRHYQEHGTLACFDAHDPVGARSLRQLALRRERLSLDELAMLEDHGFVLDRRDARWLVGFARLMAHRYERGSTAVSARFVTEDGYPLGNWLYRQRRDAKREKLADWRLALLNRAGVDLPLTSGAKRLAELLNDVAPAEAAR